MVYPNSLVLDTAAVALFELDRSPEGVAQQDGTALAFANSTAT